MTAGATADLSIFHQDRAGEQNADETAYAVFCPMCGDEHDVMVSVAEDADDSEDGYRTWWIRMRDKHDDEEIQVQQNLHTLRLEAYGGPAWFHGAAKAHVRTLPTFLRSAL
jgi:hypothetical protein